MNDNELKKVLAVVHGLLPDEKNPTPQVVDFTAECIDMIRLYAKKNHDYGDSFHLTYLEEGMAMPRIRLSDKFNRFKTLSRTNQLVNDESIKDTLLDLANYAIMTVLEIEQAEGKFD